MRIAFLCMAQHIASSMEPAHMCITTEIEITPPPSTTHLAVLEKMNQEIQAKHDKFTLKYQCNQCAKKFFTPAQVMNHSIAVHDHIECKDIKHINPQKEASLVYRCLDCLRTFPYRSRLNEHLITHSNQRPFECLICQKRFKTRWSCKEHELIHFPPQLECDYCTIKCKQPSGLMYHISIHHPEFKKRSIKVK